MVWRPRACARFGSVFFEATAVSSSLAGWLLKELVGDLCAFVLRGLAEEEPAGNEERSTL
jgi:hypothetical protein